MKKSITRLIVLVLSLVAILAFAGCELTGPDTFDSLTPDSRKGKPVTTTVPTPPPVYDGADGEVLFTESGYTNDAGESIGYQSFTYGFWAGQDNDAGTVTISNDEESFYILVDTNSGGDLQEVHIYAYTEESQLPNSRPAPGQAPFVVQNIYADSVELVTPFSELGTTVENLDDYYFIIHAALVSDSPIDNDSDVPSDLFLDGETGYAGGGDVSVFDNKGAWFYAVRYVIAQVVLEEPEEPPVLPEMGEETAWAYADTKGPYGNNFLDYGFSRWGWSIGPLTSGSYEFDIYPGFPENYTKEYS